LRAGEHIVAIGRIPNTWDEGPSFSKRDLHSKLVIVAVKIIDVLGNSLALEVLPGSPADPITCIDCWLTISGLGAQICPPRLGAGASPLSQILAIPISAFDAAKVGTLAWPEAGDEKCHLGRLWWRLLRPRFDAKSREQHGSRENKANMSADFHRGPPLKNCVRKLAGNRNEFIGCPE